MSNTESISAKLRRWADESYESGMYPTERSEIELKVDGVGQVKAECNLFRNIADEIDAEKRSVLRNCAYPLTESVGKPLKGDEDFKSWLDRYYLPRPLFEDGEPVQLGDRYLMMNGTPDIASSFAYTKGDADYVRINGHRMELHERVNRPKQQVLDADGVECCIGETVYRIDKVAGTSDNPLVIDKVTHDGTLWWKGGGCAPARLFTHRKPTVLDADGVPIEVGDTVYILPGEHCDRVPIKGFAAGDKCIVGNILNPNHRTKRGSILARSEKRVVGYPAPEQVTHREPDTQKRIDRDALKDQYEYWGCMGSCCPQCPVLVDGKKPSERYGVLWCSDAIRLDLLRRQRELDGRDA